MTLRKPYGPFDPGTAAETAMRSILLSLLHAMERNLSGTIEGIEPECLHDFRVALRRTRSALVQVKRVFSEEQIRPFRMEFKWLAALTGPTRDLDVYLLKFPRYRESLAPDVRVDLDPFLAFLRKLRREEQQKLARTLASDRVRMLLDRWRGFLEEGSADAQGASDAGAPILEVARPRIRKLYRRFLRQGRAITATSPDAQLHRLRITGKKLRYLLEFFQDLFPSREVERLIKAGKAMQDFLGNFHDLEVQQKNLQEFARRIQAEDDAPAGTLVAMGRLVEEMSRRRKAMRLDFPEQFAAFDGGKLRTLFKHLSPPEKFQGK